MQMNSAKSLISQCWGLDFFSIWTIRKARYGIFLFTNSIKHQNPIYLYNEGLMFRDMTFIDDVISGIEGAINYISKNNRIKNEIFNIGNECQFLPLVYLI